MAFDAHSNFGYSTVAVAPAPALTGLSLTVQAGQGALFPAVPFNCTVWPAGVAPLASNAEIVRVTNIAGDTLTIVRAQEGTSAIAIDVGFQIANTTSNKVFTDIETAIPVTFVSNISAGAQSASGQIVFANANGITFNMNAGTVTASHDGITSQSVQTQNAVSVEGSTGNIVFANANNITFGFNNSTVTASAGLTQSTQPVAASASNGSFLFSTLAFSNANGITFGTSAGSIISASHNALTSQSNQAASASNGSFTFQTLGFSNANNVTFGTSAGGIVTASVAAAGAGSVNFSAGTTSNNLASVTFANANGITFGLNAGTITASHNGLTSQSNQAASASNGSFTFQTLGFSNANGVTFGTSAGSIVTASVGAGVAAGSLAAGGSTMALGQVVFSNSNGISFSLNGSTVTASHDALTSQSNQAASASNGSFTFQTLGFSNANNVTFGTSAGSIITASVAAAGGGGSINFSAGTTSNNLDSVVFNNSNGVSFGLDGSTLTASIRNDITMSRFEPVALNANATSFGSPAQNLIFIDPINPTDAISFTNMVGLASWNFIIPSSSTTATGRHGITRRMAFYSRSVTDSGATNFSNSNTWVTMWSSEMTTTGLWSATSSSISGFWGWQTDSTGGSSSFSTQGTTSLFTNSTIIGQKLMLFPYATSMAAGEYLMAQAFSSSTAGGASASSVLRLSIQIMTMMTNLSMGADFGNASATRNTPIPGLGVYSVTSGAFPASLHTSQISILMQRRGIIFKA